MDIEPYLKIMADKNASDLFFCTGAQAHLKIDGQIISIGDKVLPPGLVEEIAFSTMNASQISEFEQNMEMNFAISMPDVGRFRVNIFRQRGEVSIVVRYIQMRIPRFKEMALPPVLGDLIMEKRGLILVVGSTGSGKSTSLAAMIGHRNRSSSSHILTIEDPLEFVHNHERSVVQQREVGIDTLSYENALVNALREAPDVIMIGEIRDMETMKHAINYAETGHLCLATLHANNANQAIDRILNFFPETAHRQILMDLSMNMRSIVSQRLVTSVEGKQVPAVEVLINTPYISELVMKGHIGDIKSAMKDSTEKGMVTFDEALIQLYQKGIINLEEAIHHADSKNDLSLAIRMGDSGRGSNVQDIQSAPTELILG